MLNLSRHRIFHILLIFLLGTIVYSNTFSCSFHYDDGLFITSNPYIRNISHLQDIWNFYHARFLTFLSLALNYQLNGYNVLGYHLFNLAVHLACATLVWWLVLLTLSTPVMKENKITPHANSIALLTALVFVSHPLQIESVTNIWQRSSSMAAMFYIASLCLYVQSRLSTNSLMAKLYCSGSLAIALAAMLTKEYTVTLPLMILLYEYTFLNKKDGLKYAVPFLLTLCIIPIISLSMKGQIYQQLHSKDIAPLQYFLTQIRAMMTYIRLAFIPVDQNFDYDFPVFKSPFELPVLSSLLALTIILSITLRLFSKYRLVSFSIFWFFLTLLPESSFWPTDDILVEHRLYLPLAGYSLFLVSGLYYLLGKGSTKTWAKILVLVIACNSLLTYQRNKIWKDEFTLWQDTVEKSPHKARPYNNLGNAYLVDGDLSRALSNFNKAIELDSHLATAYFNRAIVYTDTGNTIQAIHDYNKAIELNPPYAKAYNNRGNIYAQQNNLNQAMSDENKAILLSPLFAEAYNNRGIIYFKQKKFTQAIADYSTAIRQNDHYTAAYNNLIFTFYHLKEYHEAMLEIDAAIKAGVTINPQLIKALKDRSLS